MAQHAPPPYIDKDQECRCAEPHPPFITHKQYVVLKKARKRSAVDAAIEEVAFRLAHQSIAPEVDNPYSLVRTIAECYSGNCRTEHGELHGEKARMYHRARRADVEQLLRTKGTDLDPGALGPLEDLVAELASNLTIPQEDETPEERRARFVALLQDQEESR